jgi:RNA polymerase sigma-70 factor, ECF subfamily
VQYAKRQVEPADCDTPETWALPGELCSRLKAAIDELPEWRCTALMLHELRGFSYREVAVAMGSPIGTVPSRISRARDAIDWRLMIRRHV